MTAFFLLHPVPLYQISHKRINLLKLHYIYTLKPNKKMFH